MDGQMSLFDLEEVKVNKQKKTIEKSNDVIKLRPLLDNYECKHDSKCLCNRWGKSTREIEECKSELPKGFSCTGCCWYCSQTPMHNGKCKHDCRWRKNK